MKRLLSWLFVIAGLILLFFGARELFESHVGQLTAEKQFDAPPPPAPPSTYIPPQLGETFAKLTIPRLDAQLYVMEGDTPHILRRGPGHLAGTAMPGDNGNCIIAGHRDTHFRVLKDIRKGDDIVLETRGGTFLYRVRETKVISPKDTEVLQDTPTAELNLITCYPFYYVGNAPKRFVVEARLAGSVSTLPSANSSRLEPQS